MNLDKLVYDIREKLDAISDDRFIDARYIIQGINVHRALALANALKKPSTIVAGLMQDVILTLIPVDSLVYSHLSGCKTVLRSTEKLPSLVNANIPNVGFRARTVDVKFRDLEVIRTQAAGYATFEFNVVLTFLGTDGYMYALVPDNYQLETLVISAVFGDPLEADEDLEDYPIPEDLWGKILPDVLRYSRRGLEDPLNNSEPDYERRAIRHTGTNPVEEKTS